MLPFLTEHFTCYQLSTRGRGLSTDNPDHSRARHFEDIAAFVRSIGNVSLFGHSAGAVWALGGASLIPENVQRLSLYEAPVGLPGPTADQSARIEGAVSEGRLADAIEVVFDVVGLDDLERGLFAMPEVFQMIEPVVPVATRELAEVYQPLEDDIPERVHMPVLLIQGSTSGSHFKEATTRLKNTFGQSTIAEVPAGHMGTVTAPDAVARELIRFFK
jgi:pimeloyl-ACP methyl ester carboxylesterase